MKTQLEATQVPKQSIISMLRHLQEIGDQNINFVVNVIVAQHKNPWRKLQGLCKLVETGSTVRTGQFNIDVLIIDDECRPWSTLENVE